MKTELVLFFAVAAITLLATLTDLPARTWTEAGGSRTLEGDFVETDGSQVVIKIGDRSVKIDIARLSDADKAFIKEQSAKPAEGSDGGGSSLAKLTPPASLRTKPITGEGDSRKSEIVFTNESEKEVAGFMVDMLYLKADGTVGKSVPHTWSGSDLRKGKSHTVDVTSFFMEDDTDSLDARVAEITFADDSTWPPAPESPPARNGEEPVAAVVVGVIGEGDRSEPVTALHNYDEKHIKSISYRIEYLDEGGELVDKTSYGYAGGDDPILPSGKTIVISGGDGPPEGAVDAKVNVYSLTFADGTEWEAPK